MGSSARLTLVLLLIFVLGTALLLDGKDKKRAPERRPDGSELGVDPELYRNEQLAVLDSSAGGQPGAMPARMDLQQTPRGDFTPRRPQPVPPRRVEPRPAPRPRPQPAARRPAPARAAGGQVPVLEGDSWWKLAARHLKDGTRYGELQRANPDIGRLQPGMMIRLPGGAATRPDTSVAVREPARGSSNRATRPAPRRAPRVHRRGPVVHTVREGEKLWTLARRYLGKGHLWWMIYEHNRGRIDNPDRLRVGTRLVMPDVRR